MHDFDLFEEKNNNDSPQNPVNDFDGSEEKNNNNDLPQNSINHRNELDFNIDKSQDGPLYSKRLKNITGVLFGLSFSTTLATCLYLQLFSL